MMKELHQAMMNQGNDDAKVQESFPMPPILLCSLATWLLAAHLISVKYLQERILMLKARMSRESPAGTKGQASVSSRRLLFYLFAELLRPRY